MSICTRRVQQSFGNAFHGMLASALFSISLVATTPQLCRANDEVDSFDVTFDYVAKDESYSLTPAVFPGELTIASLPSDAADHFRMTIVMPLTSSNTRPDQWQVRAIKKLGKEFEGQSQITIEKTDQGSAVAKITCDFPVSKSTVERLRIRYRNPANPNPMRIELYAVESQDDVFGPWGDVNDPDEDCTIVTNDNKLEMTLSGNKCHDLNPLRPRNSPFAVRQIFGNFTYSVKVTGDFTPGKNSTDDTVVPFNGAGILCWSGEENYLRVERNAFRSNPVGLSCFSPLIEWWRNNTDMGVNTDVVDSSFFQGRSTWLKVRRLAQEITVWMSHDGKEWKNLKSFTAELPDELFIGVGAINTSDAAMTVEFEEQTLVADRLIIPALHKTITAGQNPPEAVDDKK